MRRGTLFDQAMPGSVGRHDEVSNRKGGTAPPSGFENSPLTGSLQVYVPGVSDVRKDYGHVRQTYPFFLVDRKSIDEVICHKRKINRVAEHQQRRGEKICKDLGIQRTGCETTRRLLYIERMFDNERPTKKDRQEG